MPSSDALRLPAGNLVKNSHKMNTLMTPRRLGEVFTFPVFAIPPRREWVLIPFLSAQKRKKKRAPREESCLPAGRILRKNFLLH